MNTILVIFEVIIGLVSLCTFLTIIIKPIREKIFNMGRSKEGEKCLLRSEMLRIYYTYLNCLKAKLHSIEGDVVKFRTYIDDTCEYWEYAFTRKGKGVEYLYITYGYE